MNYKIHTAQNVVLDYPLANVGQRIGAAFIDLIIVGIYFIVITYTTPVAMDFENKTPGQLTLLILILLPGILYYPLLEYYLKGRTLGKFLLKIRVVKSNGKPPSIGECMLRWLLRVVDTKIGLFFLFLSALFLDENWKRGMESTASFFLLLPLPLIGIISIIISKSNQRIGDIAAGTIVFYDRKRISLDATILQTKPDNYQPVFKQVLKLRDKDIYIIKDVVERAEQDMDHSQVIPLANKAKKILNIETDLFPLQFLKTLLKDYNFLAQEKDLD